VAAAGFTVTHSERHGLTIFQIIEARKHPDLPFSKNAPYESADL
jgi:hypothetical protein